MISYLTSLLLSLDTVLSFIVVSEGVFLDIRVQGDDPGGLLEGSLRAAGLFLVGLRGVSGRSHAEESGDQELKTKMEC